MKIMVVDDDAATRKILKSAIEKLGHSVEECADGDTCLQKLKKPNAPKIVILDWVMKPMTGLEVCKRIRQNSNLLSVYIIFLTIKSTTKDIVEGLKMGANDYMPKPFNKAELLARISVGVNTIQLQNEITRLQGLLPICSWCHKVRKDDNYWEKVEEYFHHTMDIKFTHGICPDCKHDMLKKTK